MNDRYTSLNDFIRNASEFKKQQFFEKIIYQSFQEQRKILAKSEKVRNVG
jgi:hypothetical protein